MTQIELRRTWKCPHPFCKHQPAAMTKAEIRKHYADNHKCGRCNADRHHKCKKVNCGCLDPACVRLWGRSKPMIDTIIENLENERTRQTREDMRMKLLGKVLPR